MDNDNRIAYLLKYLELLLHGAKQEHLLYKEINDVTKELSKELIPNENS